MTPQEPEKQYVLVVDLKSRRPVAYGPFRTTDDAEYAAQDHYRTAITGASIDGDFLIAELRDGGDAPAREHAQHVAALMASDV